METLDFRKGDPSRDSTSPRITQLGRSGSGRTGDGALCIVSLTLRCTGTRQRSTKTEYGRSSRSITEPRAERRDCVVLQ